MTKMIDMITRLRKYNLFVDLSDSDLEELSQNAEWELFNQGKIIFQRDDLAVAVYIVGYGAVKLVRFLPNGDEVLLHLIIPGGIFAGVIVMRGSEAKYPLTAIALEDSGVIKINAGFFRQLVSSKGALGGRLIQMISQRMLDHNTEKSLSRGSVAQRTAGFLLRTLENQPIEMGPRIILRLTRQDIANAVGTSVETVIRVLSQWTQSGIIATENQHIEILKKMALWQILENNS